MAMATGTRVMAEEAYAVYNNGTVTFYYDNLSGTRNGDVYNWDEAYEAYYGYVSPKWVRDHGEDIVRVIFDESFKNARPTKMRNFFYECKKLTTIIGIENVNTSQVKDFSKMFWFCEKLQSSLDLSGWDTSNVTKMSYMFQGCNQLPSVNVSGWDTSNVTTIEGMFVWCNQLTSLDVGNWDTSKVEDMSSAFDGCNSLEHLDVSKWNTFNVAYMKYLFYGCKSLTTLDLSNWNTSGVTDMSYMFRNCTNLTKIFCGNDWTAINVSASTDMFENCTNLVGGKGTKYDANHVDASYAHLDGGPDNPGYLSDGLYNIWVNGIQVTDKNCHDLPFDGVDFEPSTNTLELNSLLINTNGICIEVSDFYSELTIRLYGTSTLRSSNWQPLSIENGKVTITGPGKLILKSDNKAALWMGSNSTLILKDADVEANGYDKAIEADKTSVDSYVVVDHSELDANTYTQPGSAIYGLSDFTLANAEYDGTFIQYEEEHDNYCQFYGKYFHYDTDARAIRYDGEYLNDDYGYTASFNGVWPYDVFVSPTQGAPTDIRKVNGQLKNDSDRAIYNLNGQRIQGTSQQKGIYIIGGRKMVR